MQLKIRPFVAVKHLILFPARGKDQAAWSVKSSSDIALQITEK
jgi:hypothetical protein